MYYGWRVVAGAFAGIANGSLIVAGGANFPDGYPWDGGIKAWHDSIFVLDKPDGEWEKSDIKLPRPIAYGVSIPNGDSCYFIGGQDGNKSYAGTIGVGFFGEPLLADGYLPDLPTPTSMACGGS